MTGALSTLLLFPRSEMPHMPTCTPMQLHEILRCRAKHRHEGSVRAGFARASR